MCFLSFVLFVVVHFLFFLVPRLGYVFPRDIRYCLALKVIRCNFIVYSVTLIIRPDEILCLPDELYFIKPGDI